MPKPEAKKYAFAVLTIFLLIFLFLLGPADIFRTDEGPVDLLNMDGIPPEGFGEDVLLAENESFAVAFVPGQKKFTGFYLYLGPQDPTGAYIDLAVSDTEGTVLEARQLSLNDLKLLSWNRIRIEGDLAVGKEYILTITNRNAAAPFRLMQLDDMYIPKETVSGNIPLRYTYAGSLFVLRDKLLLSFLLFSVWLLCAASLFAKSETRRNVQVCGLLLLLAFVLTWNGLFCVFDHSVKGFFNEFQADSEKLVLDAIEAYKTGIYPAQSGFFLGLTAPSGFVPYYSQYGLQGRVFVFLSRFIGADTMRLFCALLLAATAVAIVYLIAQKYDRLFAAVFYLVFLLSPWVVSFARNLYWVEFTWFLPMAAGLFCAWKIDSARCRRLCYAAVFLFLFIKSLCGYEYVSTIMVGSVQFLFVDLVLACRQKERTKAVILLKAALGIGFAAIAGFSAALAIHAYYRGGGNILQGILSIYRGDVLRRTTGSYGQAEIASLAGSAWNVLCRYFRFDTQILTGINGNLFPLLCAAPLAVFYADAQRKKLNLQTVLLYGVAFFGTASWLILAKAHSAVHTHMNYVLWYFGFVQICLYTLVNALWQSCARLAQKKDA